MGNAAQPHRGGGRGKGCIFDGVDDAAQGGTRIILNMVVLPLLKPLRRKAVLRKPKEGGGSAERGRIPPKEPRGDASPSFGSCPPPSLSPPEGGGGEGCFPLRDAISDGIKNFYRTHPRRSAPLFTQRPPLFRRMPPHQVMRERPSTL